MKTPPFLVIWLLMIIYVSTWVVLDGLITNGTLARGTALAAMIVVFIAVGAASFAIRCRACGQAVIRRRWSIGGRQMDLYGLPFRPVCSRCRRSLLRS